MALDKRQLTEAVLTYTEVTSNTILESGKGYIANLNSGGVPLELTLPESFNIGDEITIVGKGSEGWVVKSNALATTQAIVSSQGTSSFSDEDSIILASSVSSTDSLSLVADVVNSIFNISKKVGTVIGSESSEKIYLGSEGQFRYNETSSQLEYKDTTAGNYTALAASSPSTPQMVIGVDSTSKDFILPLGSTQDISLNNYGLLDTEYSNWSTVVGGDLSVARFSLAGAGTQNASLAFGGKPNYYSDLSLTEKFNGSTWATTNNMSTDKFGHAGCGTQSAALTFGGSDHDPYPSQTLLPITEKFDGSTWTTGPSFNMGLPYRYYLAGVGTQNAALSLGGKLDETTYTGVTETFNGTAWSPSDALSVARQGLAGAGTQNAALAFGGSIPDTTYGSVSVVVTEKFNGVSWSVAADLNIALSGLAGAGTQNAALAFGYFNNGSGSYQKTEIFNGSTWSIVASAITDVASLGSAGTQGAALAFGGAHANSSNSYSATTEKFNSTVKTEAKFFIIGDLTKTETDGSDIVLTSDDYLSVEYDIKQYINADGSNELTDLTALGKERNDSYWSPTGDLNAPRWAGAGSGTQKASLYFGGRADITWSQSSVTEKFNGTTWSEAANILTTRSGLAGVGKQNASLCFEGGAEKFNGTSWSYTGSLIQSRDELAGAGTQNAALAFGGEYSSSGQGYFGPTEKFDGSVWSEAGDMNEPKSRLAGVGSQNAALSFGGTGAQWSNPSMTEKYNGTVWLVTSELNSGRHWAAGSGTQNAALSFGGSNAWVSAIAVTENFDGTTWAISAELNTGRDTLGGAGSQNAALSIGGMTPNSANTEKRISSQTPSSLNYCMALIGDTLIAI